MEAWWLSKAGKAAQALITPEERERRGRLSARTLGKAGRAARSAKGWETRRAAAAQAAQAAMRLGRSDRPVESQPFLGWDEAEGAVRLGMPFDKKARIYYGYCRNPCGRKRYVNPRTGKLSAQWCEECHAKQRAYDKASWQRRK